VACAASIQRRPGGRLKPLNDDFDLQRFFARLASAPERVLLLDYDGTLAPFHIDPRLALPYPGVCAVLRRVMAVPRTRVVIVSGRRLEDLRAPLAMLPHTEVWASHGWEWMSRGNVDRHHPSPHALAALSEARAAVQALIVPGTRLETKLASVAVHWRGLPPRAASRIHAAATEAWEQLVDGELVLLPFDHGLEIRARGHDKGDAVRTTLASSRDAVCAYLGDDFTDEDAFRAIRPHGLGVLVREQPRQTEAELWLSRPHEVTAFLQRWT
jgi:trehalose 6-phosphate phosphatase